MNRTPRTGGNSDRFRTDRSSTRSTGSAHGTRFRTLRTSRQGPARATGAGAAKERVPLPVQDGAMVLTYVDSPDRVRAALSPVRRDLLKRLPTPSSASRLAAELELPRQRLNYHLKALEKAGLVELVEERPRRGCAERILRTRPGALVVDPTVVGGKFTRTHDQYAAEHPVGVAAATVRDVARMQTGAAQAGRPSMTTRGSTDRGRATSARRWSNRYAGSTSRCR